MRTPMDLAGRRFGRLVVVKEAERYVSPRGKSQRRWECRCDCGKVVAILQFALLRGDAKSCGCLRRETSRKNASGDNEQNPLQREAGTTIPLIRPGRARFKNNTSGVTGVYFDKSVGKWCAQIFFRRKKIFLGKFSRKEDAVAARKRAEEEYFAPIVEAFDAEREKEDGK